jgi:hypothetical protein
MWGWTNFTILLLLLLLFSNTIIYTHITKLPHLSASKFKYYNKKKIIPLGYKNKWEQDSLQQIYFKPYVSEIIYNSV